MSLLFFKLFHVYKYISRSCKLVINNHVICWSISVQVFHYNISSLPGNFQIISCFRTVTKMPRTKFFYVFWSTSKSIFTFLAAVAFHVSLSCGCEFHVAIFTFNNIKWRSCTSLLKTRRLPARLNNYLHDARPSKKNLLLFRRSRICLP
jgi:hypothetical protein